MKSANEKFIDDVIKSFKALPRDQQISVAECLIANIALEAGGNPVTAIGIISCSKLDLHRELDKQDVLRYEQFNN